LSDNRIAVLGFGRIARVRRQLDGAAVQPITKAAWRHATPPGESGAIFFVPAWSRVSLPRSQIMFTNTRAPLCLPAARPRRGLPRAALAAACVLLFGPSLGARAGTWTRPAQSAPGPVDLMLLPTNGTVQRETRPIPLRIWTGAFFPAQYRLIRAPHPRGPRFPKREHENHQEP